MMMPEIAVAIPAPTASTPPVIEAMFAGLRMKFSTSLRIVPIWSPKFVCIHPNASDFSKSLIIVGMSRMN